MENYLEGTLDYTQSAFEDANNWLRENDLFTFPSVKGYQYEKTNSDGSKTSHTVTVKVGGMSITSGGGGRHYGL